MEKKAKAWQYVKQYKFNSIFLRSFILIVLLIILPLGGISLFVYQYNDSIMRDEIKKASQSELARTRDVVDMILSEIEILAVRIDSDPDVELFFRSGLTFPLEYENVMRIHRIQQVLQTSKLTSRYIDSILLYSDRNKYVLLPESTGKLEVYDHKWWHARYLERIEESTYWENLISTEPFYMTSKSMLSFFRKSVYSGGGVVIINLDVQALGELIDGNVRQQSILLIDADRHIVYNHDLSLFDRPLSSANPELAPFLQSDDDSQIVDFEGEQKVLSKVSSRFHKDWSFISVVPLRHYDEKEHQLKRLIVILVVVSGLVAVLLAFIIAVRSYEPIQKILSLIDHADHSLLMANYHSSSLWNETKHILTNISRTYRQSYEMEEQLRQKYEMLRKAQAIALQAQINPHFLYNTFEAINWKVMRLTNGKNEASVMIHSLSQLLRLSLDTKEDLIPLSKELEHVRLYMEMQKLRYKDKIQFKMNVKDNLMHYKVIKFMLQPLVENAIYHGIKPSPRDGMITITAYERAGAIVIRIKDNGLGVPSSKVNKLNADFMKEPVLEYTQIGMRNVNQRIQLAFGQEYRLYIRSKEQVGTIVEMNIPKIEEP